MPAMPPIAIVVPSLTGGGAERVAVNLAGGFAARGHSVDLVLLSERVAYRNETFAEFSFFSLTSKKLDPGASDYFQKCGIVLHVIRANPLLEPLAKLVLRKRWRDIPLTRWQVRRSMGFSNYLRKRNPKVVLSIMHHGNLTAIYGRQLAGSSVPIAASIHIAPEFFPDRHQAEVYRLYPDFDAVICVSHGIAKSATRHFQLAQKQTLTIYNPLFSPEIFQLSRIDVDHPWFGDDKIPVVFAVGRAAPQKDHATLLLAFSLVCANKDARLVIMSPHASSSSHDLSEANDALLHPLRLKMDELGIADKVDILGFDPNPFRYMRRANCFVSSSIYEGFSNVHVEALACGTPIVSTDCPYGPDEILESGKWGRLVPVRDAPALAQAIEQTLGGDHPSPEQLKKRASFFSVERSLDGYEALIRRLTEET